MAKKREILQEYKKKASDYQYALESSLETYDATQEKIVPFKLFKKQKEFFRNLCNYPKNITIKNRQAGVTTVSCAYAALSMVFSSTKAPEYIISIAHNQEKAKKNLGQIREFIKQLQPERFFGTKNRFTLNSQTYIELPNGSSAQAIANSEDAGRGGTPTFILLDEAAFIEGGKDAYTAIVNSQVTGGRLVMLSTPNGLDEVYYETYANAQANNNDYKISYFTWYEDPRFNKDLKWIKTDDIIDYIKKDDSNKFENVIDDTERKQTPSELMRKGYKPWSTWFEKQCRANNLDKRKIAQELQCTFIGSGDNVVDSDIIQQQEYENVLDPIAKEEDGNLWIWEHPVKDKKYIAALDVSLGTSEDYTGFCIIDFDDFKQVLEYKGKIKPDDAATLIDKYSRMYNAYTTLDITGGWGISTYRRLIDYKFPLRLLHYEEDMLDSNGLVTENSVAGLNFQKKNNRTKIVEAMETAMRNGFIVRSTRLIDEMKKFVFDDNGRPDHIRGAHDDVLMAVSMCLFIAETRFKRLEANKESTQFMLNNWRLETAPINRVETNQEASTPYMDPFKIGGDDDDDLLEQMGIKNANNIKNTQKYNWLLRDPRGGISNKRKHKK